MLQFSPFNLICIVLNLLILLVLMKKFLYKPVLGVIAKRQELLDSQFEKAKACQEEAQQLKMQYESSLSEAKEEKRKIIRDAKAQADAEAETIVAQAEEEAKQIVMEAKKTGLDELEKAIKTADTEITKLAVEAASKIVSQASCEKNDYEIYEEFLKKAGEKE